MDFGSFLLILGLLILVGLYISKPLMDRTATAVSTEEHEFSALMAERDRILNALQELEFDYTLGKIPEESYPIQRNMLLQKGAAILRQMDEYDSNIRETVGQNLLEAMQTPANDETSEAIDDPLEALIAQRRRARTQKTGGFCPQCGNTVQLADKFCPKCGTNLAHQ